MEEWKDIEGYEGLYQVSNMGRVKSLKFGKEKLLNGCKDKDGYFQIKLSKEGKVKMYKVHRLVAQAFLDNQNNLSEINHKDEDKTNNCVDNLEWCDRNYNNNYGSHNERVSKALKNRKGLSKPILQFTKDGEFIRRWDGATQVERELGIKHSNICYCLKGKQKTSGGYVWGYEKDYKKIPFKVFDLEIYKKIA